MIFQNLQPTSKEFFRIKILFLFYTIKSLGYFILFEIKKFLKIYVFFLYVLNFIKKILDDLIS